jgi:hypothetical protein
MSDDAVLRPLETEVMALLERIIRLTEEAQSYIQDDSRITDTKDVHEIRSRMFAIRSASVEIENLLRAPYSRP